MPSMQQRYHSEVEREKLHKLKGQKRLPQVNVLLSFGVFSMGRVKFPKRIVDMQAPQKQIQLPVPKLK